MVKQLYEVEKIMGRRINPKTNKSQYLVKWVGYNIDESTWQPQGHLKYVESMLHQFNGSMKNSKTQSITKETMNLKSKKTGKKTRASKNIPQQNQENRSSQSEEPEFTPQKKPYQPEKKYQDTDKKNQYEKSDNEGKGSRKGKKKIRNIQITNSEYGKKVQSDDDSSDKISRRVQRKQLTEIQNIESLDVNQKQRMCRHESEFIYLVCLENGHKVWMRRDQLLTQHSVDLCVFYEQNLTFI